LEPFGQFYNRRSFFCHVFIPSNPMQALTAPAGGRERNAAVLPLPAFTDNYIWAIVRDGQAAVVDPGEAGPVLQWLAREGLKLRAILLTHHHGDHVG
ncbi:MBL fold metallo-hydrolase, partial [Listeria seeligeri]|uniref:MBL fold metallo-hydrolase n=1 Tax=Listeria seeligeri TaxID=1640 RepID=UPI0022EB09EE